jgi:radical SAM superfamily enzyme YgiQ (UPF0313 family)
MKVLFIYPHFVPDARHYLPYPRGIGILSAIAREEGWDVDFLPVPCSGDRECEPGSAFERRLKLSSPLPDLVAMSFTSPFSREVSRAAGYLIEEHHCPVVLGGVGAQTGSGDGESFPGVIGVCRDEGEYYFRRVLRAVGRYTPDKGKGSRNRDRWRDAFGTTELSFGGNDGTGIDEDDEDGECDECVKGGDERAHLTEGSLSRALVEGGDGLIAEDLDTVPHPDRTFFDYRQRFSPYLRQVVGLEVMTSRGCPFECAYCIHSLPRRTGSPRGNKLPLRVRSVSRVVEEVKKGLEETGGMPVVGFHDDCFGLERGWLEEFSFRYSREIDLPFWANCHPLLLTDWRLELFRKAGCVRLHVGIESGDEHIRRDLLNRQISSGLLEENLRKVRNAGIHLVTFNMLGLPGEDEECIMRTIEMNRRLKPFRVLVSVFRPYPGTALYRSCKRKDLSDGSESLSYYDPRVPVENPLLSPQRIAYYFHNFVELVYRG